MSPIRRVPRPLAAPLAALALVLACAGPAPERTVLPGLDAADVDPAAGYEALPAPRASEVVPPGLLRGPHHRVRETVESDGFLRHYVIDSEFGEFHAAGDAALRRRVHEIDALARLERMRKREEFARAVARGLKSPFVAAWNLITDPVDSILGVPRAAWEAVQKTAEVTRRERGELEGSGLREIIGFEARKRELAFELGVDPYTSNRVLQKEMNRFAWAAYLGGLPFALVPFQGEDEASAEVAPVVATGRTRLRGILRHYAPEDLRRLNRIELAVMGVRPELADAFLQHAWYSPRHGTILVGSLVALDLAADRDRFIATAVQAGSEADARFYQRAAELLRAYHEQAGPLVRLAGSGRAVLGVGADGDVVAPAIVDHAVWSRPVEALAERMREARDELSPGGSLRLLVSGTLSARAREELAARGIRVTEDAFGSLAPGVAEASP